MSLRALLFSSDGTSTSTLCQVLTDLAIEADICSEVLVAVERVSKGNYDAILVDWEQEADASVLLKTGREQKTANQALNLALVRNDKDVGRALQQGANSVIKKPIDPRQAHDTLSTARDLILSRRTEQKDKEARVAALQAEAAAVAAEFPDGDEEPAQKTGFLAQTAPKSAFEVEELTEKHDVPSEPKPHWQAANKGPASLHEYQSEAAKASSVEKEKRWDAKPKAYEPPVEEATVETHRSQDTTRVFSSLAEEEETPAETGNRSHPQYLVFALVGCLLVAGVLWVWAPGDSYRGRMSSVLHSLSSLTNSSGSEPATAPTSQAAIPEKSATPAPSVKPEDSAADLGPVDTTEVDPSKIQIIETKAIPKPGAQQPPTTEAPPDSDQAKQPPEPEPPVTVATSPQPAPTQPQMQPTIQPVVIPVSRPQPPVSVPDNSPASSDGRVGVIIPDSLKTTPSSAPGSSLEPSTIPEEVSRDLVLHRVDPDYPAQALHQHLEGPVVLQVSVAKDGTIQDLKLVKGYFILARAAFDAVKQWRFKPYSPNGRPIDFQTYVTLNFKYPG
jgi:periplasmic protein TonB